MSKIMAARFVEKLQSKKAAISQWITTTKPDMFGVCFVGTVTIVSLGGIGLTLTHLLG